MTDEPKPYEPNPVTQLFPLFVAAYAWQVSGFWIGLLALVLYIGATITANVIYIATLASKSADPVRRFQRLKWALFIAAMLMIAFTGARTCHLAPGSKEICDH